MAFFKRVMDHLLNQVLVETLAHSKWFQKFAVHTHKLSKEVAEKGERPWRTVLPTTALLTVHQQRVIARSASGSMVGSSCTASALRACQDCWHTCGC